MEELTHWKRPWCWERLRAGGEGSDRGWDCWIASLTQWTWVWANSGRQRRTRKSGMLPSIGSQRVRHHWATEQQYQLSQVSNFLTRDLGTLSLHNYIHLLWVLFLWIIQTITPWSSIRYFGSSDLDIGCVTSSLLPLLAHEDFSASAHTIWLSPECLVH